MSWKGFSKSVSRAPQTFKAKFNIGDHTKDPVYLDAERRFQELESETRKLHDESKKYFDAINSMLSHQIEFSKSIQEIYKPISGRMSDPDSVIAEGNPEGIRACEEYEAIPADELLEIVKIIQKVLTKRQHKQLDYDRHRQSLKKLQEKKEKTLKDEKSVYKTEAELEQSTEEFNYFNNLLKEELPKLFKLEREFIRPLFQSFYYMQLNVFYTLHEKMQAINIGYFDLTLDVEEAFAKKRGDIQERAEQLTIIHFKTSGARASNLNSRHNKYGKKEEASKYKKANEAAAGTETPPPPYSSNTAAGETSLGMSAIAKAKGKPPPPKPKPKAFAAAPTAAETATALYDYEAQAEGDLSFSVNDTIEIIQRTSNENEWWTGKLRGKTGQFPVWTTSDTMASIPSRSARRLSSTAWPLLGARSLTPRQSLPAIQRCLRLDRTARRTNPQQQHSLNHHQVRPVLSRSGDVASKRSYVKETAPVAAVEAAATLEQALDQRASIGRPPTELAIDPAMMSPEAGILKQATIMETGSRPIYLDMQATTPTDPRVVDAMLPYMTAAREHVAALIGADPKEVVFTSGATESNNMSVKGVARFYKNKKHLITTQTEHKCVLDSCRHLQDEGYEITYLPVQNNGLIDLKDLEAAFRPDTALVSVMTVNNEIGVIQPMEEIGKMCRARKVFFHTDAAQAVGKIPVDVNKWSVDLMSISGHKIYGPKGIGACYVRRKPRVRIDPLISGGGQERGLRSGTLPAPLVIGLGEACRIAKEELEYDHAYVSRLSQKLKDGLLAMEHTTLNGDTDRHYPGCVNVSFAYVEGESLLMALKDIALSSGSACTSASLEPSYVLRALGNSDDSAHSSIRFGIGRFTTEREIDYVLQAVKDRVGFLRELSPLWELVQEGVDLNTIEWSQH
ncbi:Kynureninase [Drechslerella dactyloides]|uniref:cysteine desulfurase n=1 Tax=Drechslerella dactyloides TaxID=74499 RepID=A0AAD6IT74_DREDA|nr:Kynureninase [Drechslerella dactyloides]